MSIKDELYASFKKGDTLTKLIYLNLAVFLLINLLHIITKLLLVDDSFLLQYIAVPSNPLLLLYRPWTIITYMFLHEGFIHVLFNVLNLYWFGRFFLLYFNQKQLVGVYVLGGFFGALSYVAAFNGFPYFQQFAANSLLLGASASVLAIMMAVTVSNPNVEIQLFLIGRVKLKFIAAVIFLISVFSVLGNNAGGNIAHIGGIFAGYLFAVFIKKGKDLTSGINKVIDFFVDLFARKKTLKVRYKNSSVSDGEWNYRKKADMDMINTILEKIKQSGYDSLSADEKKQLFEQREKK